MTGVVIVFGYALEAWNSAGTLLLLALRLLSNPDKHLRSCYGCLKSATK